jgi:hypothetical protein
MTLDMFGRVNEQAQNRRWKLAATHTPSVGQCSLVDAAKFRQGAICLTAER